MSSHHTKEEVLELLKKKGITNLEELAETAAKTANEKDNSGNPVIMSWIVSPGFVINH